MAVMPIAGERARVPGWLRPALSVLLLMLAAASVLIAYAGTSIAAVFLFDLGLAVSSTILLGAAILLVAGALATPVGTEWAAVLGVLALAAAAPSLRWASLAGLIGAATALERRGERPVWIAAGVLALTSVLAALATPSWSARAQVVALACGLVLIAFAARTPMLRGLVLPTTALAVLIALQPVTGGNLVRFQWVAAAGGVLLVLRAALSWVITRSSSRDPLRDPLVLALVLIAISAHDSLNLGALAAVLLLVDLAIARIDGHPPTSTRTATRLLMLAQSNWPPSVTFAGATIAVIASLQAGLALGLLAAAMLAGLLLAPLLDRRATAPTSERLRSPLQWVGPTVSIGCGLAPALLLHMIH
jgi:hypothetical protein